MKHTEIFFTLTMPFCTDTMKLVGFDCIKTYGGCMLGLTTHVYMSRRTD